MPKIKLNNEKVLSGGEMEFSKEDTLITKGIAIIFLYMHHLFSNPNIYIVDQ